MSVLKACNTPEDIKKLSEKDKAELALEVRQLIVDTVYDNGGHMSSSLGAVELCIALLSVFDPPKDKIIFDVGHQAYAYKILTGRRDAFSSLRKSGGISGFPDCDESCYDSFGTGHSSTSVSAACGFMRARELSGDEYSIVSVIGDGALTGGMAYEAMNDISDCPGKQIIILNDNSLSINQNVGSVSDYLLKLHENNSYRKLKSFMMKKLDDTRAFDFFQNMKNSFKYFLRGGLPFDQYSINYFGPFDGHNFSVLEKALKAAKKDEKSSIIHIITQKGRGYAPAEENPSRYHGVSPRCAHVCNESYSSAFGCALTQAAEKDGRIVAVTAAMGDSTGLTEFSEAFPDRFYDVGIAEQHAVTMAAAMAKEGYKPYVAVYSTFLQRAFDQIIHDVSLQKLPVRFFIDRAGINPGDGRTHQGIYDIAYMSMVPGMTVAAPKNIEELKEFVKWSVGFDSPLAVRYPKGSREYAGHVVPIKPGTWEKISDTGADAIIIAAGGDMLSIAAKASEILSLRGIKTDIVSARFIKPMDTAMLEEFSSKKIITMESGILTGGLGQAVTAFYGGRVKVLVLCVPDTAVPHGDTEELYRSLLLDAESAADRIERFLRREA